MAGTKKILAYPEVLVVVLTRCNGATGAYAPHNIRADPDVYFYGSPYTLVSHVCHLGPDTESGHYIALAKHEEKWYLYDDQHCTLATNDQIFAETRNYSGQGNLQSYVLFYVKAD